jgi:hypothetical protein
MYKNDITYLKSIRKKFEVSQFFTNEFLSLFQVAMTMAEIFYFLFP